MKVKVILMDTEKKKEFHSKVMQNTSTVGIPKNCMNWLVLGLTIYTDMEIKDALKEYFCLSDRKKIKGRVDVDKLKALINEGLSFSEVARRMGFERITLKGFCEREGISTKRGK